MGNLGPVLWQEAFIRAVDETDTETLARLIEEAERAIASPPAAARKPSGIEYEVRAMDLSAHALEAIKVQKLGGAKLSH